MNVNEQQLRAGMVKLVFRTNEAALIMRALEEFGPYRLVAPVINSINDQVKAQFASEPTPLKGVKAPPNIPPFVPPVAVPVEVIVEPAPPVADPAPVLGPVPVGTEPVAVAQPDPTN